MGQVICYTYCNTRASSELCRHISEQGGTRAKSGEPVNQLMDINKTERAWKIGVIAFPRELLPS
jgi:hypothetical protein